MRFASRLFLPSGGGALGGLFFLYININLSQSILNCGRIFDICVVSSYNREVKAMLYRSGFYGPVRL